MILHLLHIIFVTQKKRINVAHSVGFIYKNELLVKMPGVNINAFHRETEGAESAKFRARITVSYLQFQLNGQIQMKRTFFIFM